MLVYQRVIHRIGERENLKTGKHGFDHETEASCTCSLKPIHKIDVGNAVP